MRVDVESIQEPWTPIAYAPWVLFEQKDEQSCCFASLASALAAVHDIKAAKIIMSHLPKSLQVPFGTFKTRMDYAKAVMTDQVRKPNDPYLNYMRNDSKGRVKHDRSSTQADEIKGKPYNPLAKPDMIVTLLQLLDNNGGNSHCVTVVGNWIFDSNFPQALPLSVASLNKCCTDPSNKHIVYGYKAVFRAIKFPQNSKNSIVYPSLM